MKIFFHNDFYKKYTYKNMPFADPCAESGRMESIINVIKDNYTIDSFQQLVQESDILTCHTEKLIQKVKDQGVYDIAKLAVSGAIVAAENSINEPSFAIVRPGGHHATKNKAQGFCFFNNLAISLKRLKLANKISTAFILDFDYHWGNGTADILKNESWVEICDIYEYHRKIYLEKIELAIKNTNADIIAVSAGFDLHENDMGRLLTTDDYYTIGELVQKTAKKNNSYYYGILEGGYNHDVLGYNVLAFLNGMNSK